MTEATDIKTPEPQKRKAYIYALSDPRTQEIRYVGKTCDLKRRYWDHIGSRSKNHNGHWLRSLRALNLRPIMETLEEFDDHDERWEESERFYIAYFRFLGMRLTNQESGGVAGKLASEETKRRIAAAAKGRQFSDLAKERSLAARRSPEGRANMAAGKRGLRRSAEAIEKHRAKIIGHLVGEETRRLLSEANKGTKPSQSAIDASVRILMALPPGELEKRLGDGFKGMNHTEESKAKIGSGNRGKKHTPEQNEANRQRALEYQRTHPPRTQTPEAREKIRQAAIAQHARRRAALMACEI